MYVYSTIKLNKIFNLTVPLNWNNLILEDTDIHTYIHTYFTQVLTSLTLYTLNVWFVDIYAVQCVYTIIFVITSSSPIMAQIRPKHAGY